MITRKDAILKELIEDVTKAPVFDPAQDKLKGLVQGNVWIRAIQYWTSTESNA